MKKRLSKVLALVSALLLLTIGLTGCNSKAVCYFCDKEARCTTINFIGEKVNICSDCKEDYDSIPEEIRDVFIGK